RRRFARFSMDPWTISFWRRRRSRLRDFSCMPWFPPALGRRTRPLPVIRKRFDAAFLVFIFGMASVLPRGDGAKAPRAKGLRKMVDSGPLVKAWALGRHALESWSRGATSAGSVAVEGSDLRSPRAPHRIFGCARSVLGRARR